MSPEPEDQTQVELNLISVRKLAKKLPRIAEGSPADIQDIFRIQIAGAAEGEDVPRVDAEADMLPGIDFKSQTQVEARQRVGRKPRGIGPGQLDHRDVAPAGPGEFPAGGNIKGHSLALNQME